MAHPGGRPSKYDPKYIDEVYEYIREHQDQSPATTIKDTEDGPVTVKTGFKVKLPTIEGFARSIGVNKTTLYEWSQKHVKFSNALSDLKTEQLTRLIDNGLAGTYSPVIAKLLMSANHNIVEKKEIENTDGDAVEKAKEQLKKLFDK